MTLSLHCHRRGCWMGRQWCSCSQFYCQKVSEEQLCPTVVRCALCINNTGWKASVKCGRNCFSEWMRAVRTQRRWQHHFLGLKSESMGAGESGEGLSWSNVGTDGCSGGSKGVEVSRERGGRRKLWGEEQRDISKRNSFHTGRGSRADFSLSTPNGFTWPEE